MKYIIILIFIIGCLVFNYLKFNKSKKDALNRMHQNKGLEIHINKYKPLTLTDMILILCVYLILSNFIE